MTPVDAWDRSMRPVVPNAQRDTRFAIAGHGIWALLALCGVLFLFPLPLRAADALPVGRRPHRQHAGQPGPRP